VVEVVAAEGLVKGSGLLEVADSGRFDHCAAAGGSTVVDCLEEENSAWPEGFRQAKKQAER
jgi:hypothetical protein